MASRVTPTALWRVDDRLLVAVDTHLGDPTDSYVNGSQVWLRDDGPAGITVEWRLHPVAGFKVSDGETTWALWRSVADALVAGDRPPVAPGGLWDGLEAFPAYDDECEPSTLAQATTTVLGVAPDHHGLVDHATISSEWERSGRGISITARIIEQLYANFS